MSLSDGLIGVAMHRDIILPLYWYSQLVLQKGRGSPALSPTDATLTLSHD